ncbi:MAG: hypothetical protein NTW97_06175 [Candidatus Krumholzibacteria bacterium]|nr:hypothetical protein [Candidatus Krumholzibacteria bacterium]
MKRRLLVLLVVCLFGARAEARIAGSSAVARSRAMGGALVSLADGPAALFVNPAGIVASANPAFYGDYAEPAGVLGGRELRAAIAAGALGTQGALGWYGFDSESESENLFVLSTAHRLVEGTQGSFLALGASATGDSHSDQTPTDEARRRVQRWGASYFWEDRIVLSFATVRRAGRTTLHYGMAVKTAVPIELMTGFSDGRVTGGARWTGARLGGLIAFAADEGGDVTWTLACEAYLPRGSDRKMP